MKKKLGRILMKKAVGTAILGVIGGGWFLYKRELKKTNELHDELGKAYGTIEYQKILLKRYSQKEIDPE